MGAYFENVAAFASREAAEEFKINAELIYERNREIRKRFRDLVIGKNMRAKEAAYKVSNGEMTDDQINDLDEYNDEWEIDVVQFFPSTSELRSGKINRGEVKLIAKRRN